VHAEADARAGRVVIDVDVRRSLVDGMRDDAVGQGHDLVAQRAGLLGVAFLIGLVEHHLVG
jgi:hypothetical protein